MSAVRLMRPTPVETARSGRRTLIDRYLGVAHGARRMAYTGIPDDHPLSTIGLALIDTSGNPAVRFPGHAPVLWHTLWIRDESSAMVGIEESGHTETWPIAPGDTVPVPRGAALQAPGGQLALAITVPDLDVPSIPPTHGSDSFHGHNRQTRSFQTGALRVSRWKITQPLALSDHVDRSCIVMALARDSVIHAPSSIDRLQQGEIALIDPLKGQEILPDGLAYLLTIEAR